MVSLLFTFGLIAHKVEILMAPMGGSKAAKLPETLKEAREKAAAKKAESESKKKKKTPKSKAKAKATAEPGKRQLDDGAIEPFAPTMVDCSGNSRVTMFGDDVLNAVNYTLEKVNAKTHKKNVVAKAIDLAILFAFEGNLQAGGYSNHNTWTKTRQTIKSFLNRYHALAARVSDPDLPTKEKMKEMLGGSEGGEDAKENEEADTAESLKLLGDVLKNVNEKTFLSFLGANFGDLGSGEPWPNVWGRYDVRIRA